MATVTEGGWCSRPKPNLLIVYLREDVPTETVMGHMCRVLADHGIPEPERQPDGSHKIELKDIKFAATISTGRHPVCGNMLAIEVNAGRSLGEKVLIGVAIVAIAAVVVIIAVAAANANGSGGHHHHSGGGGGGCNAPVVVYVDPWINRPAIVRRRRRARRARVAALYSADLMYRRGTVVQTAAPAAGGGTIGVVAAPVVVRTIADPEWCGKDHITAPQKLIDYLFNNIANYYFNTGFARVPSETIHDITAEPLDTRPQEVTIKGRTTRCYTIAVPQHAVEGLSDTLRADVMVVAGAHRFRRADVSVTLSHDRPADVFHPGRKAIHLGQNTYAAAAGPNAAAPLKPGHYYLSVRNCGSTALQMRIGARLFGAADKEMVNTALIGGAVRLSTVKDGDDEWEMVDTDSPAAVLVHSPGKDPRGSLLDVSAEEVEAQRRKLAEFAAAAAAAAPPAGVGAGAAAAAGAEDALPPPAYPGILTQGSDLRDLSDANLVEALVSRGVNRGTIASDSPRQHLEAQLYPLLPPAALGFAPDTPAPSAPPPAEAAAAAAAAAPPAPAPAPSAPPTHGGHRDVLADDEDDDSPPYEFCCPISHALFRDPVIAADGFTYERVEIARWFASHDTSPMTGALVPHTHVVANATLHSIITDAKVRHPKWVE